MPVARANGFSGADRRLSFVQDRATWHDLGQGPVQQTGNPLDVAIDGNAFLVVQTPRGERYTRNGALQINTTGQLVTSEGYQVRRRMRPDRVPDRPTATSPSTPTARSRCARAPTPHRTRTRGKLRLVELRPAAAAAEGRPSTFQRRPASAPQPADAMRASCRARSRNRTCSGVVEMTRMIEVTRTYTEVASMLQQQSDMRRTAIEQLAEVPV